MTIAYVITFVLALTGLLLFIGGVGGIWNRRPVMGSIKGLTGLLLMTAGALVLLIGMNLYTYHRLTTEVPVAEIRFEQMAPQRFRVNLLPQGEVPQWYELRGDEWQLDVRMIKWQGIITMLNVDAVYRFDRLSGRYRVVEEDKTSLRTIYELGVSHGLDLWSLAQQYKTILPWVDAIYGSAVYMPMADKASYQVTITHTGLVVRPGNEQAQQAVKTWQ